MRIIGDVFVDDVSIVEAEEGEGEGEGEGEKKGGE